MMIMMASSPPESSILQAELETSSPPESSRPQALGEPKTSSPRESPRLQALGRAEDFKPSGELESPSPRKGPRLQALEMMTTTTPTMRIRRRRQNSERHRSRSHSTKTQHPNEHRNDSEHFRCPEVELGCNKIKIPIRPPEVDLGILGFIIRAIAKRQIPKPTSGHLKIKTNQQGVQRSV